ncbi:MAG: PhzF family phenazine biosynthesis protein [Alphaproteobacteria bacterium]|nr:PhzF family phenazine biosynthesis protein [Alphaproteobacteria bacterium]
MEHDLQPKKVVTAHIIKAFTDGNLGGNPAAVVIDELAEGKYLEPQEKQEIAAQIGVSETVFVRERELGAYDLEFYTPTRQIDFCGHATIAAFSLLDEFNEHFFGGYTARLGAQDKSLDIDIHGDHIAMRLSPSGDFGLLSFGWDDEQTKEREDKVLKALGLGRRDLDGASPIHIGNLGNGFVLVPVKSSETLRRIRPDMPAISHLSAEFNVVGFYPFTRDTVIKGRDASARMFAPAYGIDEESATGMAAAVLAQHLYCDRGLRQPKILIEQGRHMKRSSPSLIEAQMTTGIFGSRLKQIEIGGRAKKTDEFQLVL